MSPKALLLLVADPTLPLLVIIINYFVSSQNVKLCIILFMRITHSFGDPGISLLGGMALLTIVSVSPMACGMFLRDDWPRGEGSGSGRWNGASGQAHGPGHVEQEVRQLDCCHQNTFREMFRN